MQEQMNSMNDSEEFQEVESNHSGRLSHVPSQPEVIPSSSSILSRDKRLPFDTWNAPGLQENVLGNQISTVGLPRNPSQGNSLWCRTQNTKRDRISSTSNRNRDLFRKRGRAKQGHISNVDVCERAVDHEFVNTGGYFADPYGWTAKTANIGAAIRQTPTPHSFSCWKIRFKNQVTTCSDFPSDTM